MTRVHVLIDGLVHGVGYRYATTVHAQRAGLTGWVKNLPDGRVEAVFEGAEATLQEMVDWCWQGPHLSEVSDVQATWSEHPQEFDSFRISF